MEEKNEESSLYTAWFLSACVLNWIGAALDKGPNLVLLGKVITFYHAAGLWFKDNNQFPAARQNSEAPHYYLLTDFSFSKFSRSMWFTLLD